MDLPINSVLPELKTKLRNSQIVILEAEPGAGKTTVVPIALLGEDWLGDKKILILEPRRLAAKNAASRMAKTLNEEVGGRIGYQIRFDTKISSYTKVEVLTEGIFTKRIQADPELKNVGLVIFDEFHERNLQTDIGLIFALETQELIREDLKILIMSATLATEEISKFLNASVVKSQGRSFPVEIRYLGESKEKLYTTMLTAIKKALADKGDILVFLPGSGEIRRLQKEIEEKLNLNEILVCPLYGDLSQSDQEIAIFPDLKGRRKIILSTNIAESSLTIEGVSVVIDSGLCRIPKFDPSSGMTKLITGNIAKDSMRQRTGRAGRLGPGIAYRIWTKEEEKNLLETTKPEILEADLSQFLLDISVWGTPLKDLRFLDRPQESSLERAKTLLQNLRLLDDNAKITEKGKIVAKLPLHPRLGFMILSSIEFGLLSIASLLASILNEKNLFSFGHSSYKQADLSLQVEEFLRNQNSFTAKKIQISSEEIYRIGQKSGNWIKQDSDFSENETKFLNQGNQKNPKIDNLDLSKLGVLLSFAYPDRIGRVREKNGRRYKLSSGKGVVLRENDFLIGNDFIVVGELDGDNKESTIFSACKISLDEILNFHKEKIILRKKVSLEEKTSRITVFQEQVLGELVLTSKEIPEAITPDILLELIGNYIRENGLSTLPWTEQSEQFRFRCEFLRLLGADLPSLEEEVLLGSLEQWLFPFLSSIRRISDLQSVDLVSALKSIFSYTQLQYIEKEAPEKWEVPSGSKIKLEYKKEEVVLAVKIQELFGLLETPRIASGKYPLTLHLLSPSLRPIQITKDLVGFWDKTYIEVKKELAGRYPKHPWPNNPKEATATRFAKRRM